MDSFGIIGMAMYLRFFLGTPYVWGGNDLTKGVDCSGAVLEAMRAVGHIKGYVDMTAQGIYDTFKDKADEAYLFTEDTILFFGKDIDRITHVALALNDKQLIEAGGEGKTPTDRGYIRIRPINYRSDLVAALNLH